MPIVTADRSRRLVLVTGAVTVALVAVLFVAMLAVPDDGCGSWVEQLNFLESSDLCGGTR